MLFEGKQREKNVKKTMFYAVLENNRDQDSSDLFSTKDEAVSNLLSEFSNLRIECNYDTEEIVVYEVIRVYSVLCNRAYTFKEI